MKANALLSVLVVAISGTSAVAGRVDFFGPTVILPGADFAFEVVVSETDLAEFDTVSILFGSLDGFAMSFVYDPSFVASTTQPPPTPAPRGVYSTIRASATDLWIEGRNNGSQWQAPILVGTLTIDAGTLGGGFTTLVQVNPTMESGVLGSVVSFVADGPHQDPLTGTVFAGIPDPAEPSTLLLLGLGVLVATRRRLA